MLRKRGIDPMQSGLPLWIGINLVLTFTISGLSIGGHIGGLIGGTLAAVAALRAAGPGARAAGARRSVLAGAVGVAAVVGSMVVV